MAVGISSLFISFAGDGLAAPGVGDPAPDFTLRDTDGYWHTLSDYSGQVIFLNFMRST